MFKRMGEDWGEEEGKKRRVEEKLEERLERERAPLKAKVLSFLLAHGSNATGAVVIDLGLITVYLFAEMSEARGEIFGSRFTIPPLILDVAFQAMDTNEGWVTAANTVSKTIELSAETSREALRIVDDIKVTSTYRVYNRALLKQIVEYLIDMYISDYRLEGTSLTITYKNHLQRVEIEAIFGIGIPQSNFD